MTEFLLLLGKLNLAMAAAIIVICVARRPLRAGFGAPVAYALWLLVPVACLASLLPPRTEVPRPAYVMPVQHPIAQMPITMPMVQPAPRIPLQRAEQIAPPMSPAETAFLDTSLPDYAVLLFAAWILGTGLMALYLARLQARFHATMRLGEAGPAVLGFFRPRLVMPDNFQDHYTAPEQAAILAHEHVHLARQDARINALAALLRCLCWFNPLVHLGAAAMRIDQELACDATALAGPVSRRDYARALLKSQMIVTLLPLGCNWPGAQHPLIERIALLKRKRPGMGRRIAGAGLVILAATCAGLGAWAAQPAVPGKAVAAAHHKIALAAPNTIPDQVAPPPTSGDPGVPKPVPAIKPTGRPVVSSNPVTKIASIIKPASAPPSLAQAQAPDIGSTQAQAQSAVAEQKPSETLASSAQTPDTNVALNALVGTITANAATTNSVSTALSDHALAGQIPANGMTVNDVVAWLQRVGYSARGGRTIGGRTSAPGYSVSTFFNHHPYSIQLLDCNNDRCASLQFRYGMADQSSFSRRVLTSSMLDNWNNANPLIKIPGNANPLTKPGGAIKLDVQLSRGDTYEELNNVLALWTAGVQRFYDFVEIGAPPAGPATSAAAATAVVPATSAPSAAPMQVAAATPASTASGPVSLAGMTADEVVAWLQSAGYTAHVVLRSGDSPLYTAQAVLRTGDSPLTITSYSSRDLMFGIYLRDCQEDRCRHLHFFSNRMLMNPLARGDLTDKQIAQWNQEYALTPVTRESRMPGKTGAAPGLSFDVDLPSATHDQINGALALWNDAVNRFHDFAETGTLAASTAALVQIGAAASASAGPAPLAVPGPAPANGVRPEIEQALDRAEDLFKRHDAAAAMENLKAVAAVPDLNSDEKHRAAIVRSFITPYDFNDNLVSRGGTDFPFKPPEIITPGMH